MYGIKNQLPLLQEKLQTLGDQMAAITHRQTNTTEELAKKKDELSKIQEKAHQVYVHSSIYHLSIHSIIYLSIYFHPFVIYIFINLFIDKG